MERENKRQKTTNSFTIQINVSFRCTSATAKAHHLRTLLQDADGLAHFSVDVISNNIVKVSIGDFQLQCGDLASECLPSFLWCFACISTEIEDNAIPEVTFDETDAAIHYLTNLLSRTEQQNHQAIQDTILSITSMVQESQPLSEEYSKVYISKNNILTKTECNNIVRDTEIFASKSGWGKTRHVAYPTTDLSVDNVPALQWVTAKIKQLLLPRFEQLFQLKTNCMYIDDMFVAKYEYKEGKQAGLNEHEDGSPWSFVIPLNECIEFDGGGTQFVYLEPGLFRPKQGKCVMFSGKNRHSGVPITRGVRYILAGFLGDNSNYAPDDFEEDDVSTLIAEEEAEAGEAIGDNIDNNNKAEQQELAEGATMDLEMLLPKGYLEARELELTQGGTCDMT